MCEEKEIKYVIDPSNFTNKYTRNLIRSNLSEILHDSPISHSVPGLLNKNLILNVMNSMMESHNTICEKIQQIETDHVNFYASSSSVSIDKEALFDLKPVYGSK